jgi:hypothetical protein
MVEGKIISQNGMYGIQEKTRMGGGGGVNIGSLLANPLARSQGQVKLDSDKNLFS